MKKLLALLIVPVVGLLSIASVNAQAPNPYLEPTDGWGTEGVGVIGWWTWQQDSFVNIVRSWINWTLGILWLIALCILLYGGFLMVTAAWDEEKYKKWFTILRQAAIGLILIGVARFIVSIIFWLVNLVGRWAEWQSWWTA